MPASRRAASRSGSLVALAAVTLLAACLPFGRRDGLAGGGGRDYIRIEIINNNFSDATLWAVAEGRNRERLGIVTGKRTQNFTMRWEVPRQLQIEIDLLAGERCLTEAMVVNPGDELQLQIQVEMRRAVQTIARDPSAGPNLDAPLCDYP
ncbi:MAG: hypothetical protein HY701_09010 [Gemmatimonadetes bacterium]|nr:hypothetical protein [Gemmatimonadota bacterium]